jgi:hypothetical protein
MAGKRVVQREISALRFAVHQKNWNKPAKQSALMQKVLVKQLQDVFLA